MTKVIDVHRLTGQVSFGDPMMRTKTKSTKERRFMPTPYVEKSVGRFIAKFSAERDARAARLADDIAKTYEQIAAHSYIEGLIAAFVHSGNLSNELSLAMFRRALRGEIDRANVLSDAIRRAISARSFSMPPDANWIQSPCGI
jgi:hypothetical protein